MLMMGSHTPFRMPQPASNLVSRTLKILPSKLEKGKYWSTSPDLFGTLEEITKKAQDMGYDGVELLKVQEK